VSLLLRVAPGQTDVQHADVKLITRYWLPTAAATAVSIGLAGVAAGGAQAATNIGFDAHAPGIGVSLEPGPPLSPMSVDNAIRSAEQYLSSEGFSRQGLITQLVSIDGYSTEDATAAVNSISVNWNEQAAKSAKQYLSSEGFSHSGLVTQLVSIDGYTPAQAEYGVTAAGL
jgi:hypothetical protein